LHGKRDVFLEDDKRQSQKENTLMPSPQNQLIGEVPWRTSITTSDFLESNIIAFADAVRIPAGYVVGRLHHEKGSSCSFQLYERRLT